MAGSFPYQQLFAANPQPMWVYDLESLAILEVNDAAVECYGYSRDEFLQLAISDIRPAEDVPALQENVARVTDGLDRAGIWRHRHKDGRIVSVEITSHALEFDGRRAELVMAVDVTERVEADDRLRRTQSLMRAAGRIARVGGWLLDVGTMTLEWSDEIREIHELPAGRTPSFEEALGFYAPEWRDRARALLTSCMRDGTPFHEEMEIVTATGRRFWVRTSAEATRDGNDRVAYVEGAVQNITGEHEARRSSEERLRQFLDAVPAPIWSAQPDGTLDYANRILYDYVGLSPESFHPSGWPDLVHPEDRERAKAVSDAAYRSGAPYSCELRLRRRDGAWRWHLDAGAPLRDESGRIVKYYGTVTDIHDIKAAETALREREARLSAIIEHEPECVKVVSPDGVLREMNPAGLRMIEAGSRDEAVGRPIVDLVHPDEREIFQALHRDALAGRSGEATFRIVGLKGTERWVESHAAPLTDAAGQPEAVLSVTRDITSRHRAEAELLEIMKRNELILASSAEGIHGLDADGRVMFENAAAADILGFGAEDLLGLNSHPLIHHHRANGEAYPAEDCPIYRTLRDGRTRHVENEVFFRKDGKSFPVEYTVAAMVDSDSGAVSGAVLNFRDVTGPRRDADLRALESHVLEMVSVGTPLVDILGEIADTVDRLLEDVRASVMLVDRDRLRVGAAPRLPAAFCGAIDGIAIREGSGSCGTAAARRQAVIVSDTRTDPLCADYRELAEENGVRACWSMPVIGAGGDVLATFAIYCGEPRGPEDAELAFVARVSQYVLMAIERHAAAEALRASEERLRILAENVQEVLWMTTPGKDRMVYVSPAYEAIWGRSCDALYAEPQEWMAAIHPDDRDRIAAAAVRQDQGGYEEEYRIVRPDGAVRWINDRAFPVHAADGTVQRIVGIAHDMTETKRMEIALRERLKELGCLYRTISLTTDQTRPVEAICQDVVDLLPSALMHDAVAVSRIELGATGYRSANWHGPVSSLSAPIRRGAAEAGRVEIGYVEAREDHNEGNGPFLPEERRIVEAIATHVGDMLDRRETAVRLTQSERLGAVGQLTGGIAHDFNNLLTVILGNAELLSDNLSGDAQLRGMAEVTMKAAERGAELTNRLLAFARRQPLDPRPCDINVQLGEMEQLLRRTLGEHIEIAVVRTPELWQALVDAGQLENSILNLGINARDAMPAGGRLTIEAANVRFDATYAAGQTEVEPGQYVMVAVSDTGTGMDAAVLAHVFEPFFTTKEVGQGSGLGLSMVYGFVKQSGGHIRIYSEPGQGTTVRLYLPRAGAGAGTDGEAPGAPVLETGSEKILLVEDDTLVREHVTDVLRSLGYAVVAARHGPEALEILKNTDDFDLLFTDIVMPGGMSGRALAEEAARIRPGLPVLFTSGYAENAIVHHGRLDFGVQLLQKPYRRQDLAAKLRTVLDAR